MHKLILFLLFLILSTTAFPQIEPNTDSRRAARKFENSLEAYRSKKYQEALEEISRAIDADTAFGQAYLLKAEVAYHLEKLEMQAKNYAKAARLLGKKEPRAFYYAGEAYQELMQYDKAMGYYEDYLNFPDIQQGLEKQAERELKSCKFAAKQLENPVPFDPKNLGNNVNSPHDEYSPALTADGSMLIITRNVPVESRMPNFGQKTQEDFYVNFATEDGWGTSRRLKSLNTPKNEGAQTISANGKVMVFTACHRRDGLGSCDLYISFKIGEDWTRPANMGSPVNTREWESQPSLSSDGRTLYFVSSRPGSQGKDDIWMTTRNKDDKWTQPVNLGDSINTFGEEMTPFIHADNQTLYFSTDKRIGMGGQDIYMVKRLGENQWGSPQNLGYPINTPKDETGLIVNTRGNRAYFASDRFEEEGNLDIYSFTLPEAMRPEPTTYLKGIVYNAETKEPLQAKFELTALSSQEVIAQSVSDRVNGEFLLALPANESYALNVNKPGFMIYSDNFDLTARHTAKEPFEKDVPLKPIKTGNIVTLENVFFELDKHNLKPESKAELNRLTRFLKSNPGIHIEIRGHTDNQGSKSYNEELSEKRAEVVYNYLVDNEINPERLQYNGYGFSIPVASNETEEGRAKNRRTEFKIIKN